MIKTIEKHPGCIARALKIIGDKWTSLILRELNSGNRRFNTLQTNLTGISSRTLSQRLDLLEEEAIVEKRIFAEIPPELNIRLRKKG